MDLKIFLFFLTFIGWFEINLVILLTWIRTGYGSAFIKICGSGSAYNLSGSTSMVVFTHFFSNFHVKILISSEIIYCDIFHFTPYSVHAQFYHDISQRVAVVYHVTIVAIGHGL